jgi:hypothetical protein
MRSPKAAALGGDAGQDEVRLRGVPGHEADVPTGNQVTTGSPVQGCRRSGALDWFQKLGGIDRHDSTVTRIPWAERVLGAIAWGVFALSALMFLAITVTEGVLQAPWKFLLS